MDMRTGKMTAVAALLLACASGAQAVVTIETVHVGHPGNAADDTGYGAVGYTYNMGTYEVTAAQYTEFLNKVAGVDTYGLYNTFMWSTGYGCKIERYAGSGTPGDPYQYRVAGDWANRPVNYVSWGDAARFANWLHNGQPTGAQDLSTTEDGAYYLNGATTDAELLAITREPDATWVIPSANEWYKAAHHKNDGVTGNYYDYPTSSDSVPGYVTDGGNLSGTGDPFVQGGTDPGNYATYNGDGGTIHGIGSPYYRTEVGEWENSDSPYGTFDQGGNVWEWNEVVVGNPYGVVRGGGFTSSEYNLRGDWIGYEPTVEIFLIGFRVSEVLSMVIETVPVGNTGNAGELSGEGANGDGPDRICGSVGHAYNIGKYEVTAGQYCRFLNKVAGVDTHALYNTSMWESDHGCKIERYAGGGTPGNPYQYRVAGDWANRPVDYVSWGDAARFANWLHNGQPTGAQNLSTTEDGAYFLNGAMSNAALLAVTRKPNWRWAITSEDEWYKAAYHKNDGVTGNYFNYPTSSDAVPSNDLADPDPGNNATFYDGDYTVGSPYYCTEVGAHENSDSPYGTFDQGGNVWEWNEAVLDGSYRGMRGGSAGNTYIYQFASFREYNLPVAESVIGFRVSEAPGPAAALDFDDDGDIDLTDYGTFLACYNGPENPPATSGCDDADSDNDNDVDLTDYGVFLGCYNGPNNPPACE
jgi:formylglycine-generating enzyme required for sulfatase activity